MSMSDNFMQIDGLIMSLAKAGKSLDEISETLMKRYNWTEKQATVTAKPVFYRVVNNKER